MTQLTKAFEVIEALRRRFPPPAWAMFEGVSNGTGRHSRRWADALAMSVWPSRGLEIAGFEVKVNRSDVVRELRDPKKADEVAKYCDKWWLALGDPKLIKEGELPAAWGLLVPAGSRDGVTMKIVKDAKPLKPRKLDRVFLAAILRRAAEHYDEGRLRNALRGELYTTIHEQVELRFQKDIQILNEEKEQLRQKLREVEQQLQVASGSLMTPEMIGKALGLMRRLQGYRGSFTDLDYAENSLDSAKGRIDDIIKTIHEARTLVEILKTVEAPA